MSLSARDAEGRLLGRRDEHKREANWCVDHLTHRYMQLTARHYTRTLLGAAANDLISSKIVLRRKLELEPNMGNSTVYANNFITE